MSLSLFSPLVNELTNAQWVRLSDVTHAVSGRVRMKPGRLILTFCKTLLSLVMRE